MSDLVVQLVKAVNTAMDPKVDHQKRLVAYQVCEDFKEHSPDCARCGVELVSLHHSPIIRHFGLQLLEHCVKFRWNRMEVEEKVQFKETVMQLVADGTLGILEEGPYIKDGLSRIVVELVKREWPQHWPTLLSELNQLCKKGAIQTELVLLVFLRLAEDVVAFQTLQSQRRRDVLQALTMNMTEIFLFFLELLQVHTTQYHQMLNGTDDADRKKALAHCKVAQAVLLAFTGYIEWVGVQHITAQDNVLLKTLCFLLTDRELKVGAAEVLQMIVNRKGKLEDRKPFLFLFTDDAMSMILGAAESAVSEGLDERNYVFLKHLCQVLTGVGSQLCVLWGAEHTNVEQPPNFLKYLQAILAFTRHPSVYLKDLMQLLWSAFFRHEHISKDPVVINAIPEFLTIATKNLVKWGFPSQDNHPSCAYSRVDYDNDEEFHHFFNTFRSHQTEAIRQCNNVRPLVAFEYAKHWLQLQLSTPIKSQELCTLLSPVFLEWDAMTCFLECVMGKAFTLENPPVAESTDLLKEVLQYQTQDPLLLSCTLTCVSALFPVLRYAPDLMPPVLQRLFECVVFSMPGQTKTRSRPVQNVRRHACSIFVRTCKDFPALMIPFFSTVYEKVKRLSADREELTQLEKITLQEALILLCNESKNFEEQKKFLGEMMEPVHQAWMLESVKLALSSAEKFIHHVGLDFDPEVASIDDMVGHNRSSIVYCINMILAMLKRSKVPSDPEEARVGGFIIGTMKNERPIYRNPCMSCVSQLLDNIFALVRTFNHLWLPEMRAKLSSGYVKAYDMQEHEKLAALGINPVSMSGDHPELPVNKPPLEKMQNFIATIHDNCYHILANAGPTLGYEFYTAPKLTAVILNSVFVNLEHIPDHRLRPIIRVFMRAFVQHCPSECHKTVLVTILHHLCSIMVNKLTAKWELMHKRQELSAADEDGEEDLESQEVLEDQMTRLLTRDYMDLISVLFKAGRTAESSVTMEMGEDELESAVTLTDDKASISELGKCLLEDEGLCQTLLLSTFSALSWNDTTTCMKAINICKLMLHTVVSKPMPAEVANQLLIMILRGLEVHGQHDTCQSALVGLAFEMYDTMRPTYSDMTSVLLQIPGCTSDQVRKFDDRFVLMTTPGKLLGDKKRKDAFKKLISGVIGKPLGQQFKKEKVHIPNLPPLFLSPRKRPPVVLDPESGDAGLVALFSGN
ncbi:exportin-5-like isoform X2 [Ptychodera flava]|uniref:exportin-5-like isoform X2 n=1 Tax=Ptychodera flava TaxID=63121 RepID=UPI00396A4961